MSKRFTGPFPGQQIGLVGGGQPTRDDYERAQVIQEVTGAMTAAWVHMLEAVRSEAARLIFEDKMEDLNLLAAKTARAATLFAGQFDGYRNNAIKQALDMKDKSQTNGLEH